MMAELFLFLRVVSVVAACYKLQKRGGATSRPCWDVCSSFRPLAAAAAAAAAASSSSKEV